MAVEYVGIVVILALVATLVVGIAQRATTDGPAEIGFRLAACELAAEGNGCTAADAVAAGVDLSDVPVAEAADAGLFDRGASFADVTALGLDTDGVPLADLVRLGVDPGGVDARALRDAGVVLDGVTPGFLTQQRVVVPQDPGLQMELGMDPEVGAPAEVVAATGGPRADAAFADAVAADADPAGAVPAGAVPAGAVPAGAVPAGAVPTDAVSAVDPSAWGLDMVSSLAPELLAIARAAFPDTNVITVPLETGTRFIVIGDGARVVGGDGNDEVFQLGGRDAVIDVGRGDNQVTLFGGTMATVVDSWTGNTVVRTRGDDVDLTVVDEGYTRPRQLSEQEQVCRDQSGRGSGAPRFTKLAREYAETQARCEARGWWGPEPEPPGPGEFVVMLGADGTFAAELDQPGRRTFVVEPGATVSVPGEIISLDEDDLDGEENIVIGGTVRGGEIKTGGGDDRVVSLPGSVVAVSIATGDGDDTIDLGGALPGAVLDLGGDTDTLVLRDTATGQLQVADPFRSWIQAGEDDVNENDTVVLAGQGFRLEDGTILLADPAGGDPLLSVTQDGDSDSIEQIAVVGPDGTVDEPLRSLDPDTRRRGGIFQVAATALSIAGTAFGCIPCGALGAFTSSAYSAANGAGPGALLGTVAGLAGQSLNIPWLAPATRSVLAATNDDTLGAVLQGIGAAGAGFDIPVLETIRDSGFAVRDLSTALRTGEPLAVLGAGLDTAAAVGGPSPELARARAAVNLADTAVRVADGADPLEGFADVALAGVTLADTFGAFTPPPPPPPGPGDDAGPQAQVPVPPLGPPLLYASVTVGGDPVPLEVGQTRLFGGGEQTRWRITNLGETTDDDGRTTSAVLRYQMLDAAGNPVPIGDIDRSAVVEDDSDGSRVREVQRVEPSADGTSYVVEYSWTDPDALDSATSPFADFFQVNPEFDPLSVEAWTPTPTTGLYTGLGVGASSLVNSSVLRSRDPSLSFGGAIRRQAPGQPLNVARDLALLGISSQDIMENEIANALAAGTIGSGVAVSSQEVARRVLNPAANEFLTRNQVGRFGRYLDSGDPRFLRGLSFSDPDIRFDAPLGNPSDNFWLRNSTITGISFAIPASNLAVDWGLEAAEDAAVDAGLTQVEGLSDNYVADLAGDSLAMCLGVSVPISVGARRPIWPACYYPAGQSAVARVATDPPPGVDLGPVGDAIVETCSDRNIIRNAAEQFVCSTGRNPDDGPPPGSAGGFALAGTGPDSGLQRGFALEGAAPADTDGLLGQMRTWQQELLGEGVRADSAAAVFNNRQQELQQRYGLSAREATEALGGTYSDAVGAEIVGPAIVGPAIVGPAIVGPAIVGPAIVGPCTPGMACWGNGPAGIRYVGPGDPAPATSSWSPPSAEGAPPSSRSAPDPAVTPQQPRRPSEPVIEPAREEPEEDTGWTTPQWLQDTGQFLQDAGGALLPAARGACWLAGGCGNPAW